MANSDPSQVPASADNTEATATPSEPSAVEATEQGSAARQLLGMKGADTGDTNIWKIRLQLMKPITWVPLVWGLFVEPQHQVISPGL